jgi:hypothetical protein
MQKDPSLGRTLGTSVAGVAGDEVFSGKTRHSQAENPEVAHGGGSGCREWAESAQRPPGCGVRPSRCLLNEYKSGGGHCRQTWRAALIRLSLHSSLGLCRCQRLSKMEPLGPTRPPFPTSQGLA